MDTKSSLRTEAELKNLSRIRRFVQETATALEASPDTVSEVLLAVDEAVTNTIVHGYRGQSGMIEIEVKRSGNLLLLRVRDQAPPFDPTQVPPPDLTLPLEQRPLGKMGIYMIQQLTDEVVYRVTPQGDNELTMIKNLVG
jgi:serine/threonine-protein kinase RsbW